MRTGFSVLAFIAFVGCAAIGMAANNPYETVPAGDPGKRKALLEELLARLPANVEKDAFNKFLQSTGELPPDFDLLPSQFFLPDPLIWKKNGKEARVTKEEWPERRAEIAKLTELWLLGSAPPPPGNVTAEILQTTSSGGHEVWKVRLSFGPNHAATLGVTLYLPKNRKPSPIFVCDGDRYLPYAKKAMENGFGFAIHNARDGERDESLRYADLFGKYDWSAFRRRGWSASRVVDWLVTLPFVDPKQIYIGGHSRAAKVAMTAAAFDERFAGVIASSPGSGGSLPYRYCDQSYFGESAELLTRQFPDWVHLRVRLFSGNEDKLPADSHFLYALIAPRPVLMATATEDAVESTWTVEQVYQSVEPVYELLGGASNYVQRYRPGLHTITDNDTFTSYSDFLLTAAHGDRPLSEVFRRNPIHPWDYKAWAARNPIDVTRYPKVSAPLRDAAGKPFTPETWNAQRKSIVQRLQWLIGEQPAYRPLPVTLGEGAAFDPTTGHHFERIFNVGRYYMDKKPNRVIPRMTLTPVKFGDGISGCLYLPEKDKGLPLVIWLGPFQPSSGNFAPMYCSTEPPPAVLLTAGFPVFTYDPIGTFLRQNERRDFFTKYPDGALMAKMVCDARLAIDAATQALKSPRPIYMYGYAMGGMVALFTAALDERVSAVASVAGFTPLRTDTPDKRTGGIARLSHLYGWLPRLGAFIGHEDQIPVDFNEILASLAPRKTLIVAPTLDRYAIHKEVLGAVEEANEVYRILGADHGIDVQEPVDENRLTDAMQAMVIDWFSRQAAQHK